jgi:CRP-like cAMP-binding protein
VAVQYFDANGSKTKRIAGGPSPEILERWLPFLEPVDLPLGTVLSASGATTDYVYFPVSGIVSLVYVMESGQEAKVAVVGLDGFLGISTFMGGESTSSLTFVKCTGQAFRFSSLRFKKGFFVDSTVNFHSVQQNSALQID